MQLKCKKAKKKHTLVDNVSSSQTAETMQANKCIIAWRIPISLTHLFSWILGIDLPVREKQRH